MTFIIMTQVIVSDLKLNYLKLNGIQEIETRHDDNKKTLIIMTQSLMTIGIMTLNDT